MQRLLLILAACLGMTGLRVSAQLHMPERIIYGTVYNLFHDEYTTDKAYQEAVSLDIKAMKSANLNTVLIFPMSQWNTQSRELKWERTDFLVDAVEKAGLDFVPLLLKQQQCGHYFPIWKFDEFPGLKDAHLAKGSGRVDLDFMEPEFFPLLEDYYKKVVERYGDRPNLSFYNIWNEPHYEPRSELFMENFRKWLLNKYGSLERISDVWGEPFSDWSQVDYRMMDSWTSSMPGIDYTLFRYEYTADALKKLVTTLRKYDTIHPANANPVNTPLAFFSDDNEWQNDNFVMAEGSDIHGISYYPDLWERAYDESYPDWLYSFAYNTFRCAAGDKPYIMTELVSGPQNGLALNAFYSYEDMEKLTWSAFANGCKGILYWKWKPFMRGTQSLGRGLLTIDGELADRGKAVKEIGGVMENYGKEIYAAKKAASQVAIMLDMTGLQKVQKQKEEDKTTFFMNESLFGTYKSLFDQNIGVDLVRSDRELNAEQLSQYKVIYLPFQVVMREAVALLLRDYVKNGGVLIADARTATLDEFDYGYVESPGAGLMDVFGVRRTDFYGEINEFQIEWAGNNSLPGLEKGMVYSGKYFREKWECGKKTEVLSSFLDNGEPALVRNRFGKGTGYLSAVPLGGSYYNSEDNRVHEVMQAIVRESGVEPEVGVSEDLSSEDLSLFKHINGDQTFIYALNYSDKKLKGRISTFTGGAKASLVKNIISEQELGFEQEGDRVNILLEIPPQKAAVILIQSE